MSDDVLVVGAGPAPNTYGVWVDELAPLDLDDVLAATWERPVVETGTNGPIRLDRPYGLVDTERLRADCGSAAPRRAPDGRSAGRSGWSTAPRAASS